MSIARTAVWLGALALAWSMVARGVGPTTPDASSEVTTTRAALPALASPVAIDLDGHDVPTIRAATLDDALRAQGWMHARERFLQMDLARRQAAGELGELVPQAVASDRMARPLGLRAVAERALGELNPEHRSMLDRYAEGVNALIASAAPLDYQMLRRTPAPWRAEDTLLVQLGMAVYLDGSTNADRLRAPLFASVAPEVARFFSSSAGALSMSVDGSPLPAPLPLPTADQLDLRALAARARTDAGAARETRPGSNAFAIAGSRTHDGRAVVANDMHLALTAPGIWYRVCLEWPGHQLIGLSLPGVPLIVQGTNGRVAWGFTNLTADLSDLVIVEPDPSDGSRYLVDGGSEPFETSEVRLGVAPRDERLTIRRTRFGPVVGALPDGRVMALRWPFLEAGGLDCGLFDLARAQSLEDALLAARAWRGPPQNTLVASADGRIGWTIAGSLPRRAAPTPAPVPWRAAPEWSGLLPAEAKPMIVDPPSGILTSGNQLGIAPSDALSPVLGVDEAAGDRAHRMRELLAARSDWTERALHDIQLDVRSPRLLRWRDAIIAALPPGADDAALTPARDVLRAWNGSVDTDAQAPEILDAFRREVRAAVSALVAPGSPEAIEDEAVLRAFEARAANLLPSAEGDWTTFTARTLAVAAARVRIEERGNSNGARGNGPSDASGRTAGRKPSAAGDDADAGADGDASELARAGATRFRTRGESNIASIRHPAADTLGALSRVAEMPRVALPGHPTTVRVQTPTFGASQRSVISPNHLADGILVTPAGQAGLPTSPHFRSLHGPWQKGEPFPLLPGAVARRVELAKTVPPDAGTTPRPRTEQP